MHASVNGTRIFFDVDGARVRRENEHDVERPVLLLLPGGPGTSHTHYKGPAAGFDRLRSAFQMLYVDWRGAARSDPAPPETLTLAQAVEDVEAIRQLLGIEHWAVLGASAGGIWSLAYVSTYPDCVSHLMIIHAPGRTDFFGDKAEEMARRAGVTDEHALDIYRRFVAGELLEPVEEWAAILAKTIVRTQNVNYADPEKHPDLIERRERSWNSMPTETLRAELDASRWYLRDFSRNFRVADLGHRITCPTLVITGEGDPVAPPSEAEAIHRAIASSELWIHDGGHMPHGDEQGPFFNRISRFLTENGIEVPS